MPVATAAASDSVEACTGCGQTLEAPAPAVGHGVVIGRCLCGRRLYVRDGPSLPAALSFGDRATRAFSPMRHLSTQQTPSVADLLERLVASGVTRHDERRRYARIAVALPMVVAPLDRRFAPLDAAASAVSVDLSLGGIAFLLRNKPLTSFWLVDFGPAGQPGAQAVMRPIRTDDVGDGCWQVSGPFADAGDERQELDPRIIHTNRRM